MEENNDGAQGADLTDAQEWEAAENSFAEEKGIKAEPAEEKPEEADKPLEKQEPDEEQPEGEGSEEEEEEQPQESQEEADARRAREQQVREARAAQKDVVTQQREMTTDIKEAMFKNADGKLYDADGDEIRTIEDVMGLRNPNTGKNFTEDEAGQFLLAATQNAQKEQREAFEKAEQYAEVNLSIKDAADVIKEKYGTFLTDPANAQLAKETLEDYMATLVTDPDTGIITSAPVDMLRFYNRALRSEINAQSTVTEAQRQAAEAQQRADKAEKDKARALRRTDREDVFARGDGGKGTVSKEDEEWAQAEKAYYGNR